ncbi:hypothetical protein EDB86DRAFT_3086629 [Lactarius hatsudake]|nr:hypothetical protein EDB86DRAFT_3086629 [Lactarius hatsudake]
MATDESKAEPLAIYAGYSFADDQSYQQGRSIHAKVTSILLQPVRTSLASPDSAFGKFTPIRAHGCNISESDAKQLEVEGRRSTSEVPTAQAARTLTFAELQALIDQGKTDEIPNNKHIPDALNDAVPSQSSAPQRKKPWEVASQAE